MLALPPNSSFEDLAIADRQTSKKEKCDFWKYIGIHAFKLAKEYIILL